MEFPEEPRARDPRTPEGPRAPRSRAEHETEVWLRRELAFLYGVERRIVRRARIRKEAWRAAAVAAILAMFAACWYLAAVSSNSLSSSSTRVCATKAAATGSTGSAHLTGGNSVSGAKSAQACTS